MKKDRLTNFNIKQITPKGWYLDQLQTQMDGLTNHLQEFWPDIAESGWIGGKYESWERVPYWLDGYVPLAYLLKDKKAIKAAKFYVDSIISRQQEDGWIAPQSEKRDTYDVWGIFIMLKALLGYAEINNDKKVYDAIYKALKSLDKHIEKYPLFDWAKQRWFECLIPLYAIYQKTKEDWLISLAQKLHDQGFDFEDYYLNSFPLKSVPKGEWRQDTHIVNNVMAVKCYGLYYQLTGDKKELKKVKLMLNKLNKYHGAITGAINGDECLAGLSPNHGSELCSIVELMYSLEILGKITAKPDYQEQLERLCFNALPSSTTSDMWAHQYVNQVNAPFIKRDENNIWTTNGPEANIYGLEPHFGCCTSNMHQGWPKFYQSVIYRLGNKIQINSYVPISINYKHYQIEISSYYPFKKEAKITINSSKKTSVKLLIPSWAESYEINAQKITNNKAHYHEEKVHLGENIFLIKFNSTPTWIKRKNGYISLLDGALVYALKVEQEKHRINEDIPLRELPHGDFEFFNKSPFNYGIISLDIKEQCREVDETKSPFAKEIWPKSIYIKTMQIAYKLHGNYVELSKTIISNNIEEKEFIPIGINKLHMGEIPFINL